MILDQKSMQWELPGGGLDLGENLDQAAIREISEETGYDIELHNLQPFFVAKDMAYYHSKDTCVHAINFFFSGELISNEASEQNFAEDEKILEVKFVSKDELLKLDIVNFQKEAIKKYLDS